MGIIYVLLFKYSSHEYLDKSNFEYTIGPATEVTHFGLN